MPRSPVVLWSPQAELSGSKAAERLKTALRGSAICLIPRRLSPDWIEEIDQLPLAQFPAFDTYGSVGRVTAEVDSAFRHGNAPASPALDGLRGDVLTLIALMSNACGPTSPLRVRMDVQGPDGASHQAGVERGPACLVTTYRGPGTLWWIVADGCGPAEPDPAGMPVERGTIAILAPSHGRDRMVVEHRVPLLPLGRDRAVLVVKVAHSDIIETTERVRRD